MPTTPTTEGSIVAYIKADNGDLNRGIDEAKAKVLELTATDPTVHVDVDTLSATERLAAVKAAMTQVSVAELRFASTSSEAAFAMRKLDAAIAAGVADQSKLIPLAEGAARAEANHAKSSERLAAAQSALAAAQQAVADTALAEAAAEDSAAASSDKASKTNQTNISRMGLIIAAVAVLVPMIAPLSGYVVGVSGALAGMGAAGVLAVLGIKNAMADGTAMGARYAAGLQVLKGGLDQLEQTAASNMLSGFQSAIQTINAAMPQLNGEIGQFSRMLGVVGNSVLQGVITAFRVLNPLFQASGQYIEGIAAGFQSWTQDGGLQRFASYAMSVLPTVEQTLGSLASAIMHILAALAPLGTFGLGVITVLSDVINAIPVDTLTALAVGGTAAFIAFKSWAILGPILEATAAGLGAVGVAADIAAGPVGWIIGAVALVAAGFTAVSLSTQQATTTQDTYTAALQQSNGALDENIRQMVAKQLADSGALAAARHLGLSLSDLTTAVIDGGPALTGMNSQLDQIQATTKKAANGVYTQSLEKTFESTVKVKDAINGQNSVLNQNVQSYRDQAAAAGGSATQQDTTTTAVNTLTAALSAQTNSTTLLNAAFNVLNGVNLSVAQAQTAMAAANNAVTTSFTQNGLAIDGNSAKAVSNQQAIQSSVAAAQANAKAITTQTGSTDAGTRAFMASKTALEQQLKAQGALTPAIQAYIDKLYAVPPELTTKLKVDTAQLAAAQARIDAMNGQIVNIQIRANAGNAVARAASSIARADGGPIPQYRAAGGGVQAAYLASGGSPFHPQGTDTVPVMATPGEFMVKRSSAQYAPQFIAAYNDNPKKALESVGSQRPQVVHNHTWYIKTNDAEQLFQAFTNRTNMIGAV